VRLVRSKRGKQRLSDDDVEEVINWLLKEIAMTYVDPSRLNRFISTLDKYGPVIMNAVRSAAKEEFSDLVDKVLGVLSLG